MARFGSSVIKLIKNDIVFFSIIVLITWVLYHETLSYDLIWDSKPLIRQNLLLKADYPVSAAFKHGFWELTGQRISEYDYYRPLVTFTLMVEKKIWGLSHAGLRIINIFIFDLVLLSLFVLLKRQGEKNPFAEIAICIFSIFPLNVDNIVWLVSRGDLMMLFFGICCLLLLDIYIRKKRWYLVLLMFLSYAFCLLSKEGALFFIPVLIFYEIAKRRTISFPIHLGNIVLICLFWGFKAVILNMPLSPLHFLPGFLENVTIVLAVIGFYSRSLVFPFFTDMFITLERITHPYYTVLGMCSTGIFLFLLLRSRRDLSRLVPYSFILFFLSGHLLLIFLSIYPYSVSTRYLMVPAVGFVWILSRNLILLKKWMMSILMALLIVACIPQVILNTRAYQNETAYWERIIRSVPDNSFTLSKYARILFMNGEYLQAELLLKRALAKPVQPKTAMTTGLILAQIEFERTDYRNCLIILERLRSFNLTPQQRLAMIDLKSSVLMAQGMCEDADRLLQTALRNFKSEKLILKLHHLYIGCNQWEKARNLEDLIIKKFPNIHLKLRAEDIKREFLSIGDEQKIRFYINYRNYYEALYIVNSLPPKDLDTEIMRAKLHYRAGSTRQGKEIMDQLYHEYKNNNQILNKLGQVYLKDFIKLDDALFYFEASLSVDPDQPQLVKLVEDLHNLSAGHLNLPE